ncbi:MAG: sulfatase family protein [Planctomycetota bacterium]|jgi:arylsulfatase A-like enzyme
MSKISRRELLQVSGAGAVGFMAAPHAAWSVAGQQNQPSQPPNILFILTDQQRFDTLSCNGNNIVHTPNLDRLASEGVNFTNDTCLSPLCGPSRATLLTGRLGFRHKCYSNVPMRVKGGLSKEVNTFDEVLHQAGYECEYQGKWHTGRAHHGCYRDGLKDYYRSLYHDEMSKRFDLPESWKDKTLRTCRYTKLKYDPWPVDTMMKTAKKKGFGMPHHNEAGETYIPKDHTLTAWTAQRAIKYLRTKPQGPFSLTCSILHPHAPLIAAPPYLRMFDSAKMPVPKNLHDDMEEANSKRPVPGAVPLTPEGLGSFISLYYGLVAEVDYWVGELLRALKESGHQQNTLVVFTADHGEMMGSHGTFSKGNFHEEAFRVPLLMRLPGRIEPGQRLDTPTSGLDLMPTILDYCGLADKAKDCDGISLRPVMEGKQFARPFAFGELGGTKRGRRAIRTNEVKFMLKGNGQTQLYDLKTDPGEQHNLLLGKNRNPAHVDRARKLRKQMQAYLEEHRDPAYKDLPEIVL